MDIAIVLLGLFLFSIPVLLFISFVFKATIWKFSPLFYLINNIVWFLYNPLRPLLKNSDSSRGSYIFRILFFTLIAPIYWLFIHIITLPVRIVISLYYDVIVYWSVMLDDTLYELFLPKMGKIRYFTGLKYYLYWLFGFPFRLGKFLFKAPITTLDSLFMLSTSVILPTFTMYHGSDFNSAISNIGQKGRWLVGTGNYAGSGIYFGNKKSALHYSRGEKDQGLIVARVILTFNRNVATLPENLRNLVGHMGSSGNTLSRILPFPWASIEHWRSDLGWWEYCIIQKNKESQFVSSWRIKPVAFIDGESKPRRLWNGKNHYSLSTGGATAGIISLVILINIINAMKV